MPDVLEGPAVIQRERESRIKAAYLASLVERMKGTLAERAERIEALKQENALLRERLARLEGRPAA